LAAQFDKRQTRLIDGLKSRRRFDPRD